MVGRAASDHGAKVQFRGGNSKFKTTQNKYSSLLLASRYGCTRTYGSSTTGSSPSRAGTAVPTAAVQLQAQKTARRDLERNEWCLKTYSMGACCMVFFLRACCVVATGQHGEIDACQVCHSYVIFMYDLADLRLCSPQSRLVFFPIRTQLLVNACMRIHDAFSSTCSLVRPSKVPEGASQV